MLLTIAIPTYNRVKYLDELLTAITAQFEEFPDLAMDVQVLVIDNASTDRTREILNQYCAQHPYVHVHRNGRNIGGDCNFIECVEKSHGDYVWLFGDDDLLMPKAIRRSVGIIKTHKPSLIVTSSCLFQSRYFDSYRSASSYALKQDWVFPVHHTLISYNIFARDIFNTRIAREKLKTNYGHMYALIDGLKKRTGVFICSRQRPLSSVRKQQAPMNVPPKQLEQKLECFVAQLSQTINLPKMLKRHKIIYRIVYPSFLLSSCLRVIEIGNSLTVRMLRLLSLS